MNPTNYVRQLKKEAQDFSLEHQTNPFVVVFKETLDRFESVPKFILPNGGKIIDTSDYSFVDNGFRLPFPKIIIESTYVGIGDIPTDLSTEAFPKRVIFAEELYRDGARFVFIGSFNYSESLKHWMIQPFGFVVETEKSIISGHSGFAVGPVSHELFQKVLPADWRERALYDCAQDYGAVMNLVGALQCSNVTTEVTRPSQKLVKSATKKGAFPFDEYHILKVRTSDGRSSGERVGTHRSPREHLRRGHIRRLDSGKTVWVNSCVVAAGKGGRIQKDYIVEAP